MTILLLCVVCVACGITSGMLLQAAREQLRAERMHKERAEQIEQQIKELE